MPRWAPTSSPGSESATTRRRRSWYERLLGREPSFIAHATEAVWELAEHRFLFVVGDAEGAGRATHTIFVDDLDALVEEIASRGIEPDERVTYPGKARKAIYRDADGKRDRLRRRDRRSVILTVI